ncbi:DUF1240 domain-containing protein [Buttiauxella sp. WJP83]|uniref:DUF1240 domain-containing protein n=1 Tax=Buttiauxella sp. WJP83 TaxID=2986951 RepID=UPI0022DE6D85|nr:DUF1240 domain-containing protein [Buttiauxella sp. WJP83]WBM70900.1 DUF1240 domain-containing protein [Buttiauxella sp. WJP83]
MTREYLLQWIKIKGASLILIGVSFCMLDFIIYSVPMSDLRSLLSNSNIIIYHAKAVACIGAIPLFIYVIFTGFRVFFSKGTTIPTNRTKIGKIWGAFGVITASLGFIIAFLIPIGLAFSTYSNCQQEKLEYYYVTDLELCKTIVPNRWVIQDNNHHVSRPM